MRARWLSGFMLWSTCLCGTTVMTASSAQAAERAVATVFRIEANDIQALQEQLLTRTVEKLQPLGLFVDRDRARMSLSGALPVAEAFEVRSLWSAEGVPSLPLTFELRPVTGETRNVVRSPTIRITLAVTLLRETWVAVRRLRKGSVVGCEDFELQRLPVRDVQKLVLPTACDIAPEMVVLRDIAARDVLRSVDIGKAPDVLSGAPVRVNVMTRGIEISTTAIALTDARVGDRIDVRLQRSTRILKTRVTGPGAVQLVDASP